MKTRTLLFMCTLVVCFTAKAIVPNQVNWSIVNPVLTTGVLPLTASGQMIWGDYNNDGKLDAFYIGGQGTGSKAGLYKNNGDGTFTEITTNIFALSIGSAIFIDYDNDGNLDLITAGSMDGTASAVVTIVYHNSGAPNYTFTEDTAVEAVFPGVSSEGNDNNTRILEAVDYNHDGWMDVLVNGNAGGVYPDLGTARVVALFKNTNGVFSLQKTPVGGTENFRSMNGGSIHFGDVNNDGFADFIESGYNDVLKTTTDLYLNDGNGGFTHWANSQATFTGHQQGETFFSDVNNDGWNDIVEVGRDVNNGWASFANIFINNKDNTFTKINSATSKLAGGQATVAVGDINNDGFVDYLFSGWGPGSTIFYNNGDNSFTPVNVPDITRARGGCATFADFTGDNNLDFALLGYRDGGDGSLANPTWPDNFVKNSLGNGIASNTAPTVPTGLGLSYANGKYTMTWAKSTDDFTPQNAIRYNVSIQFSNGKKFTYCPSDIATGKLKVGGMTDLLMTNSYSFVLPQGTYTFGVQAVDQANVGSAFKTILSTQTAVEEQYFSNVNVYSANNQIHIQNTNDDNLRYSLISMSGQMLKTGDCAKGASLNIPFDLAKGVYIIKLSNGINNRMIKISNF